MTNPDQQNANSVLDQLVGDGKKFANIEALAKGKADADAFIEKLANENKELRGIITAQDSRVAKLESRLSILDRLGDRSDEGGDDNRDADTSNNTQKGDTPPSGLSETDALKLIERHDTEKQHKANRQYVDGVLAKQLGSEAAAFVKQRGAELGLSEQALVQLATTSPKAFLSMLGLAAESTSQNPMYKGTGSTASSNSKAPTRNKTYYDKLKSEMGAKKFAFDRGIQIQMHKDMLAMGDAFES